MQQRSETVVSPGSVAARAQRNAIYLSQNERIVLDVASDAPATPTREPGLSSLVAVLGAPLFRAHGSLDQRRFPPELSRRARAGAFDELRLAR